MTFLLIIIGIALIVLNVIAIKKEKRSFKSTLNHAETNMEEFEVLIGSVRREFSETILELQKDIEALREYVKERENNILESNVLIDSVSKVKKERKKKDLNDNEENLSLNIIKNVEKEKHDEKNENNTENSIKINEISKLLQEGLSIEDISHKLSIGKGEVLLIKELYIR